MEREVAFGTTYLSNPCPSSSRYKLTRFRAPHTLLLLRSYTLASPLGQVRQSSDRSLSSVLGHHLAQSCAIAGRNNPPHPLSPSLSKDKRGSFETRRQWWTSLSPRLYLRGFIKRKLGNWEIEQRFRLKMIEYLLCVTGRRRKEEEEERRRRRRSECGALELAITSTIHHVESLGY